MSSPVLVDSHILLWALNHPERIGAKSREFLQTTKQPIYVSIASFWELALKYRKDKLSYSSKVIMQGATLLGMTVLDIKLEHVQATEESASLAHKDPFDLMLIAQAKTENYQLLSADRAILGLKLPFVINAKD